MASINQNFLRLQNNYLFSTIAKRVKDYKSLHPEADIISLGIGDVTLPLPEVCVKALHDAACEMANLETFHGYGAEQGYPFLRDNIAAFDYRGLGISPEEIFVSDGAKCDVARIVQLFGSDNVVAIPDPVYPVYIDTNVMAGRSGEFDLEKQQFEKIVYLPMTLENGLVPQIPEQAVDLIYLCSPNNPTGIAMTKAELTRWVNYAVEHEAIILFDSAYEAFIQDDNVPHSIYEIPKAKQVAIEFRSFSKTAGFTGLRCGYTVVPKDIKIDSVRLIDLYQRLITTQFNGACYLSQRAAAALYCAEGISQVNDNISYYLNNCKIIRNALTSLGITCFGGDNSPYLWLQIPNGMKSWDFFDMLLEKCNIVGTPGVGFGLRGEGFFRLTAFNTLENTLEAMERLKKIENLID